MLTPFILSERFTLVTPASQSAIFPVASSIYIAPLSTPSVHSMSVLLYAVAVSAGIMHTVNTISTVAIGLSES